MKYTIRVGECEETYEGTSDEIYKLMQLKDNPKPLLTPRSLVKPNVTINPDITINPKISIDPNCPNKIANEVAKSLEKTIARTV